MLIRQTLTRQVMDYLIALIETGEIRPGLKLPTEKELTIRLGVSRTCVREAVKSLESLGMIRTRPKVGTVVLQAKPKDFPTAELLGRDDQYTDSLLELRKIVEVGVASLAAERADETDILNLQRALEAYVREVQTGTVLYATDMSFHKGLAVATKNPLLIAVYEMMSPHLEKALEEVANLPGERESTIREHSLLLKAVKEKNPRKAQTVMRAHLGTVERYRGVAAVQKPPMSPDPLSNVTKVKEALTQ